MCQFMERKAFIFQKLDAVPLQIERKRIELGKTGESAIKGPLKPMSWSDAPWYGKGSDW